MDDPSAPPQAAFIEPVALPPQQYNPPMMATSGETISMIPQQAGPPPAAVQAVYYTMPVAAMPPQYNPPTVLPHMPTAGGQAYPVYPDNPSAMYQQLPAPHRPGAAMLATSHQQLYVSGSSSSSSRMAPRQRTYSATAGPSSVPSVPQREPRERAVCVTIPHAEVITTDPKKPFVVFELHFKAGDVEHIVLKRYSELKKIHDAMSSSLKNYRLPEFPPAPWFTDHTKPEHMERRRKELVHYYNRIVMEPHVLLLPKFHALMEMESDVVRAMTDAGNNIAELRRERHRAEMERKRQAEEARLRKLREIYHHSQTFHRDNHTVWCGGAQMTTHRPLTYDHVTVFNLREKFWGWGDASIKGPDGNPWFQILRLSSPWFEFRDCQYAIHNMQGEPLIFLQECFKFFARKYKIYSVMTSSCGQSKRHMFKMCSIKRTSFLGVADYEIKVASPSTSRDCHACKSLIKCEGSWGDWDTTFTIGGRRVGHVGRNIAFMTNGDYDVEVSPGQDVILFLALAVCIDKMHYEATRRG